MIYDVGGTEFQSLFSAVPAVAVGFGGMGFALRNFRIFYDARFVVFEDDEADGFVGGTFSDDFGCDGEVEGEGVSDEGGVCDTDEGVVYAVGVDVFYVAVGEISEDGGCDEREIETTVTVGGDSHLHVLQWD